MILKKHKKSAELNLVYEAREGKRRAGTVLGRAGPERLAICNYSVLYATRKAYKTRSVADSIELMVTHHSTV